MEMIANKIKIRKVKAWAIYFDYEGKNSYCTKVQIVTKVLPHYMREY